MNILFFIWFSINLGRFSKKKKEKKEEMAWQKTVAEKNFQL
jgi:hypothetical protein